MEQQKPIEDWRADITEPTSTLKIEDGDIVIGMFQDEGTKKTHPEFGTSIAFQFLVDGEKNQRTLYVKANNFSFLGQIKTIGTLTGTRVKITRTGSKRQDTRYKVTKL